MEDLLNHVQFILRDGMSQSWVDPLIDLCIHSSEHFGRLVHSFQGDVRVHVAAPEEHRCASERSAIVARRTRGSDEAAAEGEHTRISVSVTGRKFEHEASTLRESE